VPLVVFGVGWAAPAGFLVAAAMLAVFAVGYVEMARRLRSAGGFYTFVSAGLGRVLGLGTASMVTTAYGVFTASLIGAFAYFTSTTIESWTDISIPVWALLVGALVVNLAFAYFEVRITARVLGAFFIAELAGLLVFAIVVLVQGGAEGLTAAPLNPLAILDNEGRSPSSAPPPRGSRCTARSRPGSASRWRRATARRPEAGAASPGSPSGRCW
jgi:amino acid transporter